MPEIALVKATRKGQVTVPQAREKLGIEPGDILTLSPLTGGILISRSMVTPGMQAEDILRDLVTSLGQAAEQQRIHEEGDLEPIGEAVEQRAYQERYGG